ncbi:hypothetical protein Psta_4454 [Pirellula staleyi DSM 6068]|uniref:Uncharacterized protein n=1 Tax=Pirellula staleyi (strain ATCC 27377 / DSM 6068 / ICPB 4128) TaxID=530564 RepID=D2R613_PIRSD|nr:hypothetical protein Psta_4454 [Pirellula staleyi DSM 6068]
MAKKKLPKNILQYLIQEVWQIPSVMRDHSHVDTCNWLDHPAKDGQIRTTCRQCGCFLGYRPRKSAERGWRTISARPPKPSIIFS